MECQASCVDCWHKQRKGRKESRPWSGQCKQYDCEVNWFRFRYVSLQCWVHKVVQEQDQTTSYNLKATCLSLSLSFFLSFFHLLSFFLSFCPIIVSSYLELLPWRACTCPSKDALWEVEISQSWRASGLQMEGSQPLSAGLPTTVAQYRCTVLQKNMMTFP